MPPKIIDLPLVVRWPLTEYMPKITIMFVKNKKDPCLYWYNSDTKVEQYSETLLHIRYTEKYSFLSLVKPKLIRRGFAEILLS